MQNSIKLSPIKTKRREEKNRLQNLNTRLENYTLRVGEKWNEHQSLSDELHQERAKHAKEIEELKARHSKELQRLQDDLDEETDQRARLQVLEQDQFLELKTLRPEAEQGKELKLKFEMIKTQLKAEEEKTKVLETDLSNAKLEISALKRKASSLEKENKKFTSSNQRLHLENDKLKEEVSKFSTRNDEELAEIRKENANKLEELQLQYKAENQQRIDKISTELSQHYATMINQNETRIEELAKENENIKKELIEVSRDLEKSLIAHQDSLEQTKTLEFEIRVERMKRKDERNVLENDLNNARQARIDLEKRFNELMDVKIALDSEIAAYNAILEREENRVGIETPRKRPRSPEEAQSKKKRKALHLNLHLVSLDVKNECITLQNQGDVGVELTGWYLRTMKEDFQYLFPEGYVLDAGASLSLWSGKNNKGKQNWPSDIFWTKKFVWSSEGDAAILLDSEGKLVSKIAEGIDFPPSALDKIDEYDDDDEYEEKSSKCMIM